MQSKRYKSTPLGRQFLGKALAIMPKASHDALQDANSLMCAAYAADMGLPCNYKEVALVRPSRTTYQSILLDTATNTYAKTIQYLSQNGYVYISADKANSEKGGATKATLPKLLTFV